MRLETKRLILRDWQKSDVQSLLDSINNLKVSQNLAVVSFPYTLNDAEGWFNHCSELAKETQPKGIELVIELKSEKRVIGAVGLSKIDYCLKACTFGYWLGENYWRQGIMSEALKAVLKFYFEELKLNRIEAGVFAENPASALLLKKLGFVKEGMQRQSISCKSTGKVHDEFIYAMIKEDYLKAKNSWK